MAVMPKTSWWIVGLSLTAACGSNPNTGPVVGARYNVTETGVVPSALDPTDGTFEEPVQSAPDWVELRIGPARQAIYLPKGSTPPDLSYYNFGRSGVQYPTRPTRVGVEIAGLDWHQGDSLQIVSPNVGVSIHELEVHFDYPAPGATRVSRQTMDWTSAAVPLVDSKQGDTTWVAQMASAPTASGSYYSVLARAGVAAGFTVTDGGAATLNATLAPVARDKTLDLHWKGTEYAALAAQAGPDARPAAAPALSIRSIPEPLARNNNFYNRYYMYLPSLVDFGPIRGTADLDQTIQYGNPFSTKHMKWTDFVTMVYAMPVAVPGVGATHALVVQASPVDALAGGVLAPAISPVRNVQINGQPATAPRAAVGLSPAITWDAPAIGTVTGYTVTVQAIARRGAGWTISAAGTFHTRSPSITLPEAAMKSVSSYVLTITAISAQDRDLTAKPFLGSLPYASADYVTAQITP